MFHRLFLSLFLIKYRIYFLIVVNISIIVLDGAKIRKILLFNANNFCLNSPPDSARFGIHTLEKQRLKITQLEKVRFIKVNELKLT